MKIEKNKLIKAEYLKEFGDHMQLKIPSNVELILNSIRIYVSGKWMNKDGAWKSMTDECSFVMQKEIDGIIITPKLPEKIIVLDTILLRAEQVVEGTVVNIDAGDYVDLTEKDGCYTFTLSERVVI